VCARGVGEPLTVGAAPLGEPTADTDGEPLCEVVRDGEPDEVGEREPRGERDAVAQPPEALAVGARVCVSDGEPRAERDSLALGAGEREALAHPLDEADAVSEPVPGCSPAPGRGVALAHAKEADGEPDAAELALAHTLTAGEADVEALPEAVRELRALPLVDALGVGDGEPRAERVAVPTELAEYDAEGQPDAAREPLGLPLVDALGVCEGEPRGERDAVPPELAEYNAEGLPVTLPERDALADAVAERESRADRVAVADALSGADSAFVGLALRLCAPPLGGAPPPETAGDPLGDGVTASDALGRGEVLSVAEPV